MQLNSCFFCYKFVFEAQVFYSFLLLSFEFETSKHYQRICYSCPCMNNMQAFGRKHAINTVAQMLKWKEEKVDL